METANKSVAQLKSELEQAEKLELKKEHDKRLADAQKWVGKCYSSHLFQRVPNPSKEITIRKITSVEVNKEGKVYYNGINATFRLHQKSNVFSVQIMDYKTDSPFPSWISSFSHEISEELFDTTIIEVKAHAETYFDKMRSIFKQTEYITMGDSHDESSKLKWLSNENFITLESTGYQCMKDLLSWNHHPFLYGFDQLLYTKRSIEIVKEMADELIKNARQWGGTILERDYPRYEKMMKFYNQHITNFK